MARERLFLSAAHVRNPPGDGGFGQIEDTIREQICLEPQKRHGSESPAVM
jgi:hypothetical protein